MPLSRNVVSWQLAEKECGAVEDAGEDSNLSMDSAGDIFFDAKETLSPTK